MLKYSYDPSGTVAAQTVAGVLPPQILGQPVQQVVEPGRAATFSVVVADARGGAYQWKFNGADIPGATGDSLLLNNVSAANAGQYSVVVTNSVGSVTSAVVALSIGKNGDANDAFLSRKLVAYSDPGGTVTVTPMKLDYDLGETVTLTATPVAPNVFIGWAGDLSTGDLASTTNPITFVMNGSKTVRARFASPTPLPPGLKAFWRGETDATDLIGGHHGTFVAGAFTVAPPVTRFGKVGGAFAFDGTVYVRVSDSDELKPAQITVEAWVFPLVHNSDHQTVIARGSATNEDAAWWMGLFNDTPRFWSKHVGFGMRSLDAPSAIPLNKWTHLAISFDSAMKRLYVNGAQVASESGLGALIYEPPGVPVTIGSKIGSNVSKATVTGRVDEVSLYRRALSSDEISSIADAGPAGKRTTGPYINSPSQLPFAIVGQAYSHTFTSILATAPIAYALSTSSALPPGLSLPTAGVLSGVPSIAGKFTFVVRATDGAQLFAEQRCALQAFEPIPIPAGASGWWRAEGSAQDSVNANHGTLRNGAGFSAGKVGQAFSLDGTSGFVEIPDAPALRPASLTLEAWVAFDAVSGVRVVFGKLVGASTSVSYALWLENGTLRGVVGDATGRGPTLSVTFSPLPSRWYHLAYTFDDGTKRHALYLDGSSIASDAATKSIGYDNQPLLLGRGGQNGVADFFLQGRIDESAIYGRALNAAEVASLYIAGPAGKRP
jgi:Concanavalin A-like lectin/glucanases superfamily/Divergent InlB B-repeat domain